MSKKTTAVAPKTTHEATVRRLGPGVYRAEDLELGAEIGCGWVGPVREGHWWEARKEAEADADEHSGREPKPAAKGPTPNRPMRIPDPLWDAVLGVAEDEGLSASEISRQALAADPRVAARLEAVSA
jgi:hypothetical protein